MKQFAILVVLLASAVLAFGQDAQPTNVYAAGVSYNQGASPAVAGSALYARALTDGSGTYAFTVFDALPASTHPFTVTSNVGAGIAQKLFTVGSVNFYAPTSAGISFTGANTGWQWNTGLLASLPVKKGSHWRLMPNVRLIKSSIGGGGYQPVAGFMLGYVN